MYGYDVIILGGGIAGMTAAIYTARANLRTVILEERVCGGLVNSTHVVENFPSYPSINGMDLMEKVLDHVDALQVDVREALEIDAVDLQAPQKMVRIDEGDFTAPAVIVATGRMPKRLPLDTECEQIHYCAICDGSAYRGRNVLVVGGGNSGVDESLYMVRLGVKSLTLIEECDHLFAAPMACELLQSCENVEIITSTRLIGLEGEKRLHTVRLQNSEDGSLSSRQIDGVFVYIGQEPKTGFFRDQLVLDYSGYIVVDAEMKTNLPGVFAAGDVVRKKYRQITTAMGDGTIAALTAANFISSCNSKV